MKKSVLPFACPIRNAYHALVVCHALNTVFLSMGSFLITVRFGLSE
jgi:hypothetical protein